MCTLVGALVHTSRRTCAHFSPHVCAFLRALAHPSRHRRQQIASSKQQAASSRQQATGNTQQAAGSRQQATRIKQQAARSTQHAAQAKTPCRQAFKQPCLELPRFGKSLNLPEALNISYRLAAGQLTVAASFSYRLAACRKLCLPLTALWAGVGVGLGLGKGGVGWGRERFFMKHA